MKDHAVLGNRKQYIKRGLTIRIIHLIKKDDKGKKWNNQCTQYFHWKMYMYISATFQISCTMMALLHL
jgi:hypothetical protein